MRVNALLAGLVLSAFHLVAQAPAGAPAGSNGLCKDGTYSTASHKSGACSGHKGVQTWYAADAGTVSKSEPAPAAAKPASSAAQPAVTAPSTARQSAPAQASPFPTPQQASGGGPGVVWVNTASKVYHCSGTAYYGKTKAGKYVSEATAKAEGDRPDHGKTCGQ